MRLLWAGFVAILAAGVGFGVRGGIFTNWADEFGFSGAQLGMIGGAGFTGFCFGIIIGGVIVDKIGYAKLVIAAFLFHTISAFVTLGATEGQSTEVAFNFLYWGTFIFALANGTLEAVANPLVSTLFPNKRTHYLNILHASWPLGMVIGGLIGWFLGSGENAMHWKGQLALYLVPTLAYGVMFFGQKYPQSEASEKGLSFAQMFREVGYLSGAVVCFMLALFARDTVNTITGPGVAPTLAALVVGIGLFVLTLKLTGGYAGSVLLFFLFIAHVLVGAVELGTDGWIQNITGVILNPTQGKILFVFTSLLMFVLRFAADAIEKNLRMSPVGLLLTCAVIAVIGLNAIAAISGFGFALGAVAIYAIGKTFFWPTMLAVVGDRFPSTGAVAMSLMGGVGMMSAGLIGNVGLGYLKDRYAVDELKTENAALYEQYKSEGDPSSFFGVGEVQPLDGKLLEEAKNAGDERTSEQTAVVEADVRGARRTLRTDALIPAAMALIYLGMLLYFKKIGGYKPLTIEDEESVKAQKAAAEHAGEA
ncbi:MFS transporter [Roseibacillus ishigakijimensis]|uniref:MFS transporter n=2 Tax=Roseibacillus ishigakijimensis TaxID=454146 RepID=A0A934RNJ8_9BACT|nr:MFS transporter [Roseibacillus ishigakijimensis]MBK1832932.1 MFS transporter [Roseibacillus ishigakijimensis]